MNKLPHQKLLDRFEKIEELNCVLEDWCADDEKSPEDYPLGYLVIIAQERLSQFDESGHVLNDWIRGYAGDEDQKHAKSQLGKIKRWIESAEKFIQQHDCTL